MSLRTRSVHALAAAALAVGLSACSSAPTFTHAGQPVIDLAASLQDAEAQLVAAERSDGELAVADDAACWALAVGQDAVSSDVICGPVARRGGQGPWAVYTFQPVPADDGVRLTSPQAHADAVESPGGTPVRPDGREVPEITEIPPPALAVDAVVEVDTVPQVLPTVLEDATLRFPRGDETFVDGGHAVTVVATGRFDELGNGYDMLAAPEGHELLVAQLDGDPEVADAYSLLVDGARHALVGRSDYLVAVVPSGADEAALEVRSGQVTQTLSLVDGTRAGNAPLLWYRDITEVDPAYHYQDTVPWQHANGHGLEWDGELHFEFAYDTAALVPADADGRPAASGRVFLRLDSSNVRATEDGPMALHWEAESNTVVVLDDGTEVPGDVDAAGSVYFDVPEDIETVTVVVRPTGTWKMGYTARADTGDVTMAEDDFVVTFP